MNRDFDLYTPTISPTRMTAWREEHEWSGVGLSCLTSEAHQTTGNYHQKGRDGVGQHGVRDGWSTCTSMPTGRAALPSVCPARSDPDGIFPRYKPSKRLRVPVFIQISFFVEQCLFFKMHKIWGIKYCNIFVCIL